MARLLFIFVILRSFTIYGVWSNFEITDMNFFRSEAYQAYFDFLDKKGGFYYEVRLNSSIRTRVVTQHGHAYPEVG